MTNVLIIGLGLIGGSYAKGLTKAGYDVYAIDTNSQSIDFATKNGIIKKGSTNIDTDLISTADLIIFGLYPKTMISWIFTNQHFFKKGAVITDVSGVKCGIIDEIETFLRDDVEFIASHPMAGKEVSGVENADENIFLKANFIITPTENSSENAINIVQKLAKDLNFMRISTLTPQEHDQAIGFLSQLTHAIAVSLMNCNDNDDFVKYTGDSFRDLTRIAMINENLWSELFFCNRDILVENINTFQQELENLKQTLINDELDELKDLFISSTNRRKKYLRK